MESINYHEESTNSSEEAIEHHSDQENNDLGVGRSYECVFCKRGFNTAQALGGHMNIHRKDRARTKPNPNKLQHDHHQIYTAPRLYHHMIPASSNHSFSSQDHPSILTCATYFPASPSSTRPSSYDSGFYHHQSDHSIHHQAPVDWRMSLSLEFPPRIMEDHVEKNTEGMNQEKDLDLELRLGYDS